jgi:NADPH:quinone reductase-like Zn-dependent oxidoreductase
VILDTAGRRSVSQLRRALTTHGRLVIVGGEGGGRWLGGFQRQMLWAPMLSLFVSQRLGGLTSNEGTEALEFLGRLIEAGKLTPVIDKTYPLSEAPDAIRRLQAGQARGKVVITVEA